MTEPQPVPLIAVQLAEAKRESAAWRRIALALAWRTLQAEDLDELTLDIDSACLDTATARTAAVGPPEPGTDPAVGLPHQMIFVRRGLG